MSKIKFTLEIEFESWFEKEREPKTPDEWKEFFLNNIMPESSVIGIDDGEYQDMVALNTFDLEFLELKLDEG
jgi:hypothetical protein